MKSIISGAVMATAIVACLAINVQAKSFNHLRSAANTVSVADTGKMAKKKMAKTKMAKKKMAKDTTKKMSKM